jgi:hypothetical protein
LEKEKKQGPYFLENPLKSGPVRRIQRTTLSVYRNGRGQEIPGPKDRKGNTKLK